MDNVYMPPYAPPDEAYWESLLEEGPLACGDCPEVVWKWAEPQTAPTQVWDEARRMQKNHLILHLDIDGYNRGGLIAHWKGVECFIPASHLVDYPFPADPAAREARFETYLGRTLRLCIIEVEPARNRILLSERQVEECEQHRPAWPEWLCEGQTCSGDVTSVRPFGVFVDIGPLEGMIHISEISWARVRHPEDFLTPGQHVKVLILNVDPEHQRVGLSLKRLTPNPWDKVASYIQPGETVLGSVVSIERFGVFVELVSGLEGLLHISEICNGDESNTDLHHHYTIGQEVEVCVLEIVPQEHRIALGLPQETSAYDAA